MPNSLPAKALLAAGLIAATVILVVLLRGPADDSPPVQADAPAAPAAPQTTPAPEPASTPEPPAPPSPPAALPPIEPSTPNFYSFPARDNPPNYPIGEPEKDARFTRNDDGTVVINTSLAHTKALNDPAMTAKDDIEELDSILRIYRWAYQQNPVGDNEDIVSQLTGNNPMKLVVIPPDHPAIEGGRLLDRFGNPYFFHAVSEKQMDIWSTGPDGAFGTQDDVKLHEEDYFDGSEAATD